MGRLAGKTALVTGGSSGIGLAAAKAMLAEGAAVAITGRDEDGLKRAADELGGGVLCFKSDASDVQAIEHLVGELGRHWDGLDAMFLNAGIGGATPIRRASEEAFDRIYRTNVKSIFFTVQKALPLLRPGSSIILNASIAPRAGVPGMGGYAASKAAVRALARSLSAELASAGVRVNSISPGAIATRVWDVPEGADPEAGKAFLERLTSKIPMKRMGSSEEIAKVVVFLASDDSSYMLGTNVTVDGGLIEMPGAA